MSPEELLAKVQLVREAVPHCCSRPSPDHRLICIKDLGHDGPCWGDENPPDEFDETDLPASMRAFVASQI